MIKAIIFDMDGLMIDSERVTFECYQERLKDMNLTMDEEFYKTLLGKPIKGIYQRFYDVYGNDFPIENVIQDVHQLMAERFETEGVPVKKGLVKLLHYLKDNNYKTIVATSSNRDRVDKILAQAKITEFFDDSICGDEVTKGKPNPEVFLKSCQKLGVNVDEAIVLEDSEAGIQASYDANIKVICIPDMKYPEKQYEEKTFKILKDLTEVTAYLKSL
ncbi:hydrolase [Faecalibacillus intestinalis]|jgi:HAD superfamily hydrolase (TIGR01509 family)|uniref:Hydrolase n=1 Tax=Faecalibacillus intestinalis TaxID=1982626 RepID=A0A2T3G564_9FIRM|nr:HAD family phosphatase [Faecalibacillus intestinalis]PST42674.1 hydrolase [Faecalibacillus intestinalis]RGG07566.1 HAD family phosphatase [Coprobacillus sp. AF27-24BH]RHQ21569.1 HAD family phosphatase [Coprobacillus sp. AF29-3BH]